MTQPIRNQSVNHPVNKAWAEQELGNLDLGDIRRTRRLVLGLSSMLDNVGKSIPEATGTWSDCKAHYRLLEREEVTYDVILDAHRDNSIRRTAKAGNEVVLNVQDTSTLNFQTHTKLEGQGPIGSSDKATGFHLHATALVGADSGEFHGLLGAKLYARDPDKRRNQTPGTRNREPIEEKESYRWLESMEMSVACRGALEKMAGQTGGRAPEVVNVGDREADIYELLCQAQRHRGEGVHLLVRSQHNRKLDNAKPTGGSDEDEETRLWDALAREKRCGKVTLQIPRSKGMKRRQAVCEVRFKEVTLAVPGHKAKYAGATETITLTMIDLVEIGCGGGKGIHWKLLTTWPVSTMGEALRVVKWYSNRWHIEVYFRVLKTGCRVEDRQLRSLDRLWPMIALDMITASYLMGLTSSARAHPATPATAFFSVGELEALSAYNGTRAADFQVPSQGEAVRLIARLGGHLGRKGDGPPGAEVLWRGIIKLRHISEAWDMFAKLQRNG